MRRILYISYTGLGDPLGQSQVLQYLKVLSGRHRITLLTFEKPETLSNPDRMAAITVECAQCGIDWRHLTYHRRPVLPATLYDLASGVRAAIAVAREMRAEIVHARSYLPGIMALAVKRATGARFIFDMRGFWADERADAGIWKRGSLLYRLVKRVERQLFTSADHVISLTRSGVRELSQFDYLRGRLPPVTVIPTCTNLELFRPARPSGTGEAGFTLGYVGSVGSWYMFDEVARAIGILFAMRRDARFLVINQGDHQAIRMMLERHGVDVSRAEIRAAPYRHVASEIQRMDAGIFFIKPVWSKRASCPTRMGEFLACGKPCLANEGVGDVGEDLLETGTGIAIAAFDDDSIRAALERLVALTGEPEVAERCRAAAEARFSLETGVRCYDHIYESLAARPLRARNAGTPTEPTLGGCDERENNQARS